MFLYGPLRELKKYNKTFTLSQPHRLWSTPPSLHVCAAHIVSVGNKKRRRPPLSHTRALYLKWVRICVRRPSPFNNR